MARIKQSKKIPFFKKKLYKQSIAVLKHPCSTELEICDIELLAALSFLFK